MVDIIETLDRTFQLLTEGKLKILSKEINNREVMNRMEQNSNFFSEANRRAWNGAMPYHRRAMDARWDELLADQNFIYQKDPELSALLKIGITGKTIIHLCCNNGIELMSLKRMGAGRCIGIDICDEAIKDARLRAEKFAIPVEFYRHSVFEIPEELNNSFDLVYITIGALTWLSDLKHFFSVVRRLLRKNGSLFIYESHPFMQVLPWEVSVEYEQPVIQNSYFCDSYLVSQSGLDYYGNVPYESPDTYEFTHTLSDILTAIISNKLCIPGFFEYEHDISNGLGWVERCGLRLPLSYILTARVVSEKEGR